jgi:hypothetical protein
LAHELTHVVQQEGAPPNITFSVGAVDDPLEREADLVAERIVAPGNLPAINGGAPAALRRVIIIKAPATTTVDIVRAGVIAGPTSDLGRDQDLTIFNLGNGFNRANPSASRDAFNFLGTVVVTFDPGDPTGDFTFGWIQFMKQVQIKFVYAGRQESEGQIICNALPAIGTKFMIDRDLVSGAAFSPFAKNPTTNTLHDAATNELTAKFGDQPEVTIPQSRQNEAAGVGRTNFLFSLLDQWKAVTIFVIKDKFGRFTQLAHVNWKLSYEATFKWREGNILPATNLSSFDPAPAVKGPPTDPEIVSLMAGVSATMSPVYNAVVEPALQRAQLPPSLGSSRQDLDHQEIPVPPLFFLEGRGSLDIP